MIASSLLYFISSSLFAKSKKLITVSIFISGLLVSLISLLGITGVLAKIPLNFLSDPTFSTLGGKLPEIIFLIITLPLGIGILIQEKETVKKLFLGTSLAIIFLTISLSSYKMLSNKANQPALPSYSSSWSISIDTIKESPFFGIGPGNYITAFNRFRPVSFNSTDVWSLKFATSRSFFLTNLTETGLVGFGILLLLTYLIYRKIVENLKFKKLDLGLTVSLGLSLVSLIFFPFYIVSVFIFFILLSVLGERKEVIVNLRMASGSKAPGVVVAVLTIVLLGSLAYSGTKFTLGEYKFTKALTAVAKDNAQLAYDTLRSAIMINPNIDRYHSSFSQMNIALASAIAQKKDITDGDKDTITQLIQAAISEAKAAVSLNLQRSGNWDNLGRVYQSIMAFAQGSDNFAIQSYSQAISLDPVNPDLRIALGGVYYALGRYDEAISSFQLATLAKGDLANAHYNLSAAFREKGEIEKAINEMDIVLSLVQKDSNDYNLAKAELEALQKKLPAKTTASDNLTPPVKTEQIIKPAIELNNEANPPPTQ